MRNFRKTRKRGGAETVFVCKTGRTENSKCIKDFTDENNLTFINVAPDGNCFFHTLALYYRKKGNLSINKGYKELRETIVNYILENWPYYSGFGIDQSDVLDFMEDGAWNLKVGDFVVPVAARALNLKMILYDLKPGTKKPPTKKRIIKYIYPEDQPIPIEEVTILRINQGHFGLLVPKEGVAPNRLASNLAKMKLANKPAAAGPGRAPSRSPERTRVTGYALRSRTNKKPVVAGPGRSPSPPKRRTTRVAKKTQANLEAEALQAAIESSLANQHRAIRRPGGPLPNNFYNMLASFEEK